MVLYYLSKHKKKLSSQTVNTVGARPRFRLGPNVIHVVFSE